MAPRKTAAEKKKDAAVREAGEHLGDLGTGDGFLGRKVDPRPNSDHSLEGGPDGVPADVGQREGLEAANAIGAEGPGEAPSSDDD